MSTDTLEEAVRQGREAGQNTAAWMQEADRESCTRILMGYNDGDPEILDMQPSPLSGQWVGESIPELSEATGLNLWDTEVADAYETGYSDGFWDEVIRWCAARAWKDDPELPRGTTVRVKRFGGSACYVTATARDGAVQVVMVGDDRKHEVDRDELELLEEGDYCSSCGWIGCTWG